MNKFKLLQVLLFTAIFCSSLSAQKLTQKEPLIFKAYKFTAYSIETDKKIQKEFTQNNLIKIIYTCIPSGIVVFELIDGSTQKATIEKQLKKTNPDLEFIELQDYSLKQAEDACSSVRTVKQSNN